MSIKLTHDQIDLCRIMYECYNEIQDVYEFKMTTAERDVVCDGYDTEMVSDYGVRVLQELRKEFVEYLKENEYDYDELKKNATIRYRD